MAAWLSSDLIARFGRLVEVQAWDLWLQDRGFVLNNIPIRSDQSESRSSHKMHMMPLASP